MRHYFEGEDLIMGRMISHSKSSYREQNPDNEIYFNANIFILGEGKIWYGDLDLNKDRDSLERISSSIGKDLFILREIDGRFGNENLKDSEIIGRAVCKISK